MASWCVIAEETTPAPPAEGQAAAADTPDPSNQSATPEASGNSVEVHGSFEADTDVEWAGDESDIDFDQFLRLRITFPDHPTLRINGALWLREDLGGDDDSVTALRDLQDAFDSDAQAHLLNLNIEADDIWGDSTLRIGRQRILDSPVNNRIDGLYFKQNHARWDWYVFGGMRASLYEDAHEDAVGGGGFSFQPLEGTRIGIDTYFGEEDRDSEEVIRRGIFTNLLDRWYPRSVAEEIDDKYLSISLWQTITENMQAFGRVDVVDGGEELTLSLTGLVPKLDVSYDVAYRRRLSRAQDRVDDLSRYYRIMGSYEEYDDFLVSLHKPINDHIIVSLESEIHNSHEENQYTGNWDYERYVGIVSLPEFVKGADATVALEYWNAGDEGRAVVTGEVTKKWDKVRVSVGADYEAFEDEFIEYNPAPFFLRQAITSLAPGVFPGFHPIVSFLDQNSVSKRENVYSLYTKLKWLVNDNQNITARLSVEEDDGPDSPYWRAHVGYAIEF